MEETYLDIGLGNPYKVKDYGLEESLRLYRIDFYNKLETNPEFKRLVLECKGKRLGCWCKPESCHGDIIAEYLDWARGGENSLHKYKCPLCEIDEKEFVTNSYEELEHHAANWHQKRNIFSEPDIEKYRQEHTSRK